jgi:DNA-directed RNA polymerase subunit K/omega
VKLPAIVEVGLMPLGSKHGSGLNRFHIAALAFQRTRQLKLGARPRVDAPGHKVVTLALLEVLADTISWSTEPAPPTGDVTHAGDELHGVVPRGISVPPSLTRS